MSLQFHRDFRQAKLSVVSKHITREQVACFPCSYAQCAGCYQCRACFSYCYFSTPSAPDTTRTSCHIRHATPRKKYVSYAFPPPREPSKTPSHPAHISSPIRNGFLGGATQTSRGSLLPRNSCVSKCLVEGGRCRTL